MSGATAPRRGPGSHNRLLSEGVSPAWLETALAAVRAPGLREPSGRWRRRQLSKMCAGHSGLRHGSRCIGRRRSDVRWINPNQGVDNAVRLMPHMFDSDSTSGLLAEAQAAKTRATAQASSPADGQWRNLWKAFFCCMPEATVF